ncbi:MAG: TldD/PmbA family protein [Eubacteriales bacterium]|jgi:TldD protein|nr:TldD/PmbA family protein [Eubacteriales bacterium]MDD4104523.1 TldD/PmbA family protein [Eubacteriales bacterium]MDD4710106.1 TldD/PmbA family protein [Eubacteriales bacterium]NLO15903.1 TldD/PmbA family protein [Clostridiales bacterium]
MAIQWKLHLDAVMQGGASYADVRYYPREENSTFTMWNGNMRSFEERSESGLGVRVLYKGAWGFAASCDMGNIGTAFTRALDNARAASSRIARPVRLADKDTLTGRFKSPYEKDPLDVPPGDRIQFMREMDAKLARPGVSQRVVTLNMSRKTIEYYDTQGAQIVKEIHELFPQMEVMGEDKDGEMQQRTWQPPRIGSTRGWEIMKKDLWSNQAERIVRELRETLEAPLCPKGLMSVILLPDIMYLQVHETIGHPLELDRILGYELSYAGGSFVTLDDFGSLQYGSRKLNVRADATLDNSPGSFGYDDDGVQAQNRVLIKDGTLVGAITSRQMTVEANDRAGRTIFESSGGTARATSFYRTPLERMTNISVDPGNDGTLDDIVSRTQSGVILSGEKSWSIGSNREQFHFATHMGWLVKDGARKGVLRNCAYSGQTLDFYRSLAMLGDLSTWEVQFVDNCGKGAPSQVMQLGHGVPVCRFDNVKVG